jgi:uncharacterized metal-binding protein YceD (DUF177 family)
VYHENNFTFAPQFSKLCKVNHLKEFNIRFRGLSVGFHKYNWEIDKKFFEAFENADIEDSNLKVEVMLEKQDRMMILNFTIQGEVKVLCDRCLDDLHLPVDLKEIYIIKFGPEKKEESENVIVIPESEYQIDISLLINEYVTLSLPIRKVHADNDDGSTGCNRVVIKKLEELSKNTTMDPRWEQLKNIKLE